MSANDLIHTIEELKHLEELIREAEQEAEAMRDSIKAEMLAQGVEELKAGTHIVRWTTLTNRFDTTAFKKKYDELYKAFTKQTTSRRFTIA